MRRKGLMRKCMAVILSAAVSAGSLAGAVQAEEILAVEETGFAESGDLLLDLDDTGEADPDDAELTWDGDHGDAGETGGDSQLLTGNGSDGAFILEQEIVESEDESGSGAGDSGTRSWKCWRSLPIRSWS